MYDVTMPKLSDSMEVGKIIEWKVAEGDIVSEGDVLADVESDKATMELECFHDGTIAEITHGDGEEVPVGETIAQIAPPGEEAAAKETKPEKKAPREKEEPPEEEPEKPAEAKEEEKPEPEEAPEEEEAEAAPEKDKAEEEPEKEEAGGKKKPEKKAPPKAPGKEEGRVRISPYARKLAEKLDLDVTKIEGTGVGGRIMARDVEEVAGGHATVAETRPSADEELPALEVDEDEAEVSDAPFRMRTQVRRVVAAKHVIPHFYMTAGADVTRLLERKETLKAEHGATVTHVVMLAVLKALAERPDVNRSYDRGQVYAWKHVNLGLAIQTDEGLTVAVLPKAETMSLAELAETSGKLVERARAGKLKAEDRRHPTFTVSNLGMYGVEHFEPIINPPSSVTLGVGAALDAPVVRAGGIHVAKVMRLTASCDHRIVEGVAAAELLQTLVRLLEDPDALLASD